MRIAQHIKMLLQQNSQTFCFCFFLSRVFEVTVRSLA